MVMEEDTRYGRLSTCGPVNDCCHSNGDRGVDCFVEP